ncbi:HNH endonuclease [Salmonella phage BP12A]|uniref:HNH endonuclease n=1 Tax=Salmonella phage BP12A TaxID=1543199 RepID=A0A140XFM2_9CAUD|nr:endonuclease [Salmonella phage BP12A]AIT13642.1 HNH endonuclease [Salmonella phage BP12A]
MNVREKILERVRVTSAGCWEWTGAVNSKGYGQVWCGESKKTLYCHRVMSEAPTGTTVLHSCDNTLCCNPAHLSIGTPLENSEDMVSKGRSHKGYKLTDADVMNILQSSESGKRLSQTYGVSQQTISDIRNGRTYGRLRR